MPKDLNAFNFDRYSRLTFTRKSRTQQKILQNSIIGIAGTYYTEQQGYHLVPKVTWDDELATFGDVACMLPEALQKKHNN